MTKPVGEERLGERARHQLEVARVDPRIARGRGAMVADLFDAFEEAERTRELSVWGLMEIANSVTNEHDTSSGSVQVRQAGWERAELAKAELDNEHPHLNAMALISMVSALDACIEDLVPTAKEIYARAIVKEIYDNRLTGEEREMWESLSDDRRAVVQEALVKAMAKTRKKPKKLFDVGAKRYETLLKDANLQAWPDKPIPNALDIALGEIGALRHVLVHRAGRVDEKALEDAPTLAARYSAGDFVRISKEDYRTYSAALRAYASDVVRRPFGDLMKDDVDLSRWRDYYRITVLERRGGNSSSGD